MKRKKWKSRPFTARRGKGGKGGRVTLSVAIAVKKVEERPFRAALQMNSKGALAPVVSAGGEDEGYFAL